MLIKIPSQVEDVLRILSKNGHEAFLVGGCVRDSLIGSVPQDWDVTTSARPEEVEKVFSRFRILKTGIQHGTVTVVSEGAPVEVTTFRVDGCYSDGRRPDSVTFAGRVEDDLARRDFTVNALAYNRQRGLVDCFGGADDLRQGRLKTVGNPDERFREDGLRILRALRFSSVLGFTVEPETSHSILRNAFLLENIARERIREELFKLLCGKNVESVLREYREVVARFVPEIRDSFGFEQHNSHHIYDVWEHTLRSVSAIGPEPVLRVTMFLHDLGKPFCFTRDENGVGHFYGHADKGAEMARDILTRLHADGKIVRVVSKLVENHDTAVLPNEKSVRRALNRMGEENLRRLLKVARADNAAKAPACAERAFPALARVETVLEQVLAQKQCYSLKDLAVNGGDLLLLGVPKGVSVGRMLNRLLEQVLDGDCPNEREILLNRAGNLMGQEKQEEETWKS